MVFSSGLGTVVSDASSDRWGSEPVHAGLQGAATQPGRAQRRGLHQHRKRLVLKRSHGDVLGVIWWLLVALKQYLGRAPAPDLPL